MAPVDFEVWLNHFEYHAQHFRCLPRGVSGRLKPSDRQLIARSLATFQLGEQSEGHALLKAAKRLGVLREIPSLGRIFELWIHEEQRHAVLLRAFMEDNDIALRRADWTDQVFRRIRRLAGLELYLHVLITAELIGIVYYRALEKLTSCQRLKILCRVLVSDELAHAGFESQLLLFLRASRTDRMQTFFRMAHRGFFMGTAMVVWLTHRTLLRRTGYDMRSFLRACQSQYAFYLEPVPAPGGRTVNRVPARGRPDCSAEHAGGTLRGPPEEIPFDDGADVKAENTDKQAGCHPVVDQRARM